MYVCVDVHSQIRPPLRANARATRETVAPLATLSTTRTASAVTQHTHVVKKWILNTRVVKKHMKTKRIVVI